MFELAEEPLDQIALAIDAPTHGSLDYSLAGGGNMSPRAAGLDHVQESVGVIATIGHYVAAREPLQQEGCSTQIVSLPRSQYQPNWQSVLIDRSVDFGAQSSTRAANGVIFAPFLPPAAC